MSNQMLGHYILNFITLITGIALTITQKSWQMMFYYVTVNLQSFLLFNRELQGAGHLALREDCVGPIGPTNHHHQSLMSNMLGFAIWIIFLHSSLSRAKFSDRLHFKSIFAASIHVLFWVPILLSRLLRTKLLLAYFDMSKPSKICFL